MILEKLGPVAQACYPSTWEAEAGASHVQTSLGYMLSSFKASLGTWQDLVSKLKKGKKNDG